MCTGIRFALAQTKAALMTIIRDYKIIPSIKQKPLQIDTRAFATQTIDGIWVHLLKRKMFA